jgi:hypothetical protein
MGSRQNGRASKRGRVKPAMGGRQEAGALRLGEGHSPQIVRGKPGVFSAYSLRSGDAGDHALVKCHVSNEL